MDSTHVWLLSGLCYVSCFYCFFVLRIIPHTCGVRAHTRLAYLYLILAYYGIPITVHPTATWQTKFTKPTHDQQKGKNIAKIVNLPHLYALLGV